MADRKGKTDYLELVKEQFNSLQTEYLAMKRKYELLSAASSSEESVGESYAARLLGVSESLCESDHLSDIRFVLPSGRRLPAHRFVLIARGLFENRVDCDEIEIEKEVDEAAFIRVYRWMYTDRIELELNDEELLRICEISCTFRIEHLKLVCIGLLSSRLNSTNCIEIFVFAEKFGIEKLEKVAGQQILAIWDNIPASRFDAMSAPVVNKLIKRNSNYPLHSIIELGREDVLFLYLMENENWIDNVINRLDGIGVSPLEVALIQGSEAQNFGIAKTLLEKGANVNIVDNDGVPILLRVLKSHNLRAADIIIENGADLNSRDPRTQMSMAHYIAQESRYHHMTEWIRKYKDRLELDALNSDGLTPLMMASRNGFDSICRELVECGAIVDISTKQGRGLFFQETGRRSGALLEYLLNRSQIRDYPDIFDELLCHFLKSDSFVEAAIVLRVADGIEVNGWGDSKALHLAAMRAPTDLLQSMIAFLKGESICWVTSDELEKRTAIQCAIASSKFENVDVLIAAGGDIQLADGNNITPLVHAIREGNENVAVFLFDRGARFRENDTFKIAESPHNVTPLEYCCDKGMARAVRAILSTNCDVNARGPSGYTALQLCVERNAFELAAMLHSLGATLDAPIRTTNDERVVPFASDEWAVEQTLLHRCLDLANQHAATFLVESIATCDDLRARRRYRDAQDDDGFSAVHMAVAWSQHDVLRVMVEKDEGGELLGVTDVDGRTPAHIAVRERNEEALKILLAAKNVDFIKTRDRFGQTILSQAMLNNDHTIGSLIVTRLPHAALQTNGNGENLFHSVIRQNNLQGVLYLIAVADVDPCRPVGDGSGKTPLHLAAVVENEMILRNLLLTNENVNCQSADGSTPLHDAIRHRRINQTMILIENGADVNATDEHGENALLCAVRSGSLECIRAVLSDPRCQRHSHNKLGFTSLHICATHVVEKLPSRTTAAELVELLLTTDETSAGFNEKQHAAFVDARDADGNTALMLAYSTGNSAVCRALLRRRACMGARNNCDVNVFTYETATKQLLLGLLESLEGEPRWSDADSCDCGTRFSLTQRKHHCRHCGRHVCSKCSETTMPIAKYGEEKRVRVCDVCAHVISTGTAPRSRF